MARVINGTLYVSVFNTTINPGEYTFTGAAYDNQADATGNGAFDLAAGFILFVQATDINLATPVPGVMHRYKLTSITVVDSVTIDGTILWDEDGPEVDQPTNGGYCIISEKTAEQRFGAPSAVGVYSNLPAGADISAISTDIRNTTDDFDAVEVLVNDEGSTITIRQVVYKSSDSQFKLALATNAVFSEGTVFGVVLENSIANGASGRVLVAQGVRVPGFTGLTINQPVYLSRTTPGAIAQNLTGFQPGDHVIKVGTADKSTGILFEPEYDYEF